MSLAASVQGRSLSEYRAVNGKVVLRLNKLISTVQLAMSTQKMRVGRSCDLIGRAQQCESTGVGGLSQKCRVGYAR